MNTADLEARIRPDTVLPGDVAPAPGAEPVPRPGRAVLLTGATGYLGGFLLAELLLRSDGPIYCLVRKDTKEALNRVAASLSARGADPRGVRRLTMVRGNLAAPRLGLSDGQHLELARTVDAIYHCGAMVNMVAGYPLLKKPNVDGTMEILRLAGRVRPLPVHYVSTVGVLMGGYAAGLGAMAEEDPLPGPGGNGYCVSKWVVERLIRQAADRGLPVTVHRPGAILPDSATGLCSSSDWLTQITVASVLAGCSPDHDFLLPVGTADFTSRCIVELASRPESAGRVFHIIQREPLRLTDYFDRVASCGYRVPTVSYDTWVTAVRALNSVGPGLVRIAETLPRILLSPPIGRPAYATATALTAVLGNTVAPPPLDRRYFTTLLGGLARTGALPPPASSPSVDS
ncbi:thioester reductase domain-containing protein [Nonomuraea sp. SBT364]|uniref:thioester reductase domain-containing protein n=1 Tax=Nonomuraea sp. SBT364 TaxID=1580530 RepID=UPI00069F951A|nr:thioester reductase domain-containing protein [Nonomuraea sp. SBT364]